MAGVLRQGETACRVAVGAVADKILKTFLDSNVKIRGAMVQMGEIALIDDKWAWDEVEKNDFFAHQKKQLLNGINI